MDTSFFGGIPVFFDGGVHVLVFGIAFDPGGFQGLAFGDVDDFVNGLGLEMLDGKPDLIDDPFVRGREDDLGNSDDCTLTESVPDFVNPFSSNDDGGLPMRLFVLPL